MDVDIIENMLSHHPVNESVMAAIRRTNGWTVAGTVDTGLTMKDIRYGSVESHRLTYTIIDLSVLHTDMNVLTKIENLQQTISITDIKITTPVRLAGARGLKEEDQWISITGERKKN
ncbi:hypothetical protein J6590_046841 [Homalodisca vitripennis]|nr:hypothetical protein J6590_046841 [Homalodisca vitripennis]